MTISRDFLRVLRADIDAALVEVAKRHGLKSLTADGCKYRDDSFTFSVEGVVEGGLDRQAAEYEMRRKYDDKLPALGTTFKQGVRTFTVVGANRGSKIIAARDDGKRFLFPHTLFARLTQNATG
jgi:hypothetical protein